MISVVFNHVRLAYVPSWDEARAALRNSIMYGCWGNPEDWRRDLLRKVDEEPVNGRITVSARAGDHRFAADGEHGLIFGDLACVHDYPNGFSRWTVHVKCKVLSVTHAGVQVRITSRNAIQFSAGDALMVPVTKVFPRGHEKRA